MCVRVFICSFDCYSIRWILHHASQPGFDIISSSCVHILECWHTRTHACLAVVFFLFHYFLPCGGIYSTKSLTILSDKSVAKVRNWQVRWFFHCCFFFSSAVFVVDVLLLNAQWVRVLITDANAFLNWIHDTQWKVIMVCRFNSNENKSNQKISQMKHVWAVYCSYWM